jgi:hypothetical protein
MSRIGQYGEPLGIHRVTISMCVAIAGPQHLALHISSWTSETGFGDAAS